MYININAHTERNVAHTAYKNITVVCVFYIIAFFLGLLPFNNLILRTE